MVKELLIVADRGGLIVGAIVLFCFIQSPADTVNAAVYECKGANGSKVLTDRPKGFQGCVMLETLAPSPSGTGASQPGFSPSQEQDGSVPPVPVPQPMLPHLSPGRMPHEPVELGSVSDQSSQSSGQESQPCRPGINPLNPLARGHCASAASSSSEPMEDSQQPPQ